MVQQLLQPAKTLNALIYVYDSGSGFQLLYAPTIQLLYAPTIRIFQHLCAPISLRSVDVDEVLESKKRSPQADEYVINPARMRYGYFSSIK